jgi:hypothetical protein
LNAFFVAQILIRNHCHPLNPGENSKILLNVIFFSIMTLISNAVLVKNIKRLPMGLITFGCIKAFVND